MAQAILRMTLQEAAVKVWGAAGTTEVIDLTELVGSNEQISGDTQVVNILGISWTGAPTAVATITRDSETIATLQSAPSGTLLFDGQTMPPDNVKSSDDITVTFTSAHSEVWLKLRKVSGYVSKSGEYGLYGSYEDETRVGASTTVSGSPDYVSA